MKIDEYRVCRHHDKYALPVGVNYETTRPAPLGRHPVQVTTIVLWWCRKCRKVAAQRLDGHWNLFEVRGVITGSGIPEPDPEPEGTGVPEELMSRREFPDSDVHVDRHMTPSEYSVFQSVLLGIEVPYVRDLIAAGKLPSPAEPAEPAEPGSSQAAFPRGEDPYAVGSAGQDAQ